MIAVERKGANPRPVRKLEMNRHAVNRNWQQVRACPIFVWSISQLSHVGVDLKDARG